MLSTKRAPLAATGSRGRTRAAALVAARIKKRYPPAELDKEEVMQALHAGPPAPALGLA